MNNNETINTEISENIRKINPKQLYAIACVAQYIKKEQINKQEYSKRCNCD